MSQGSIGLEWFLANRALSRDGNAAGVENGNQFSKKSIGSAEICPSNQLIGVNIKIGKNDKSFGEHS